MAYFVDAYWVSDGSGITRADRRGCSYRAYVPDPIAGRTFMLDSSTAADVADAEAAVIRLNASPTSLVNTEALARILLRAEAVASSKIEGLVVGPRRLLEYEAGRDLSVGLGRQDVTAEEVLSGIDAMARALELAGSADPITVDTIKHVHKVLLTGTHLERYAGVVRDEQNWVGGSAYNPCSAQFVPPPPDLVPALLDDLAAFCNEEWLSPVAQAAIAHAQFETIHPFADGNGRVGRALVHLILRRRGIAPQAVPPVSLVLSTLTRDYVAGLESYRYQGDGSAHDAVRGLNRWTAFFAGCCARAVRDSVSYEARVRAIQDEWRGRFSSIRRNSAVDLLLGLLPGTPIVTVASAAGLLGRTPRAARLAIDDLVEAGVLTQVTVGRRNRAFEAREIIDAFTDLERRLGSPDGETRMSPPSRPVPARPSRS